MPSQPRFDPPRSQCPLCRSPDIHDYDRDHRGARIARCATCGIKFMNPQYTDEYLAEYYSTYVQEELDSAQQREFRFAQKTANIELIERFVKPGRLFSIGCGDGVELQVAKSRGWSVEAYDVDPVTTARIAKKVGATIHTGNLFALPLESDTYDCVYLDQVLEHPKNPGDYLRLCHRMLKRDGVLYIGVPNIDSLASLLKTTLGKAGLKKRRGRHYDTFHHLFYYSPSTLPGLLARTYGFRVLHVQGDPKPNLSGSGVVRLRDAIVRKWPRLDSSFEVLARPVK
jgi:2-polyprenyl-3-methyl-5-hydroxy-6-metoxy-1,4-benzoquinol methylase